MGTISSVLSTASNLDTPVTDNTTSTSGTTNYFSGLSSYSQDLQSVIGRAVSIASLPIQLLTAQQDTLNNQSTELTTLDSDFTAIQTAIQNISSALSGSSMNSSVSNPAVAGVTLGDGAVQGAYTISVSSIGAYANSLSTDSWDSAASSSAQATAYNLVVGGNTYTFTPSDSSAATVASTINAQYGNLVQATAVNVGSAASPDYRISLQSANLGPLDLDIQSPPGTNVQTAGAAATGYAASLSSSTWDSSGSPSTYTLVVDGNDYTVSPTDNSATSVAAAINALSGNPVTASVVNVGTAASPDERLQLQSNSAGVTAVDLQDSSGNSLQQQQAPPAAGSATSLTSASWSPTADSSGNPIQYTLTVGGVTQTFTSSDDDSAAGVAAAINALSGNPVTATVVDVGSASNPDYRLLLVDNTASGQSPQLSVSTPFSLQTQGQPPGSLAQYEVANSGKTVTSDSRDVAIAAGTTLTLTGTGTTDVTVTQSISALNTALSGFADAYNAAVGELAKQYGQQGGALQGQGIVYSLSQALSKMSTYYSTTTGSIGMTDLGFTLNLDGTLTYSPLTMMSTDLDNSAGVISFLGSATGGGFLETATNAINSVEETKTGLLKNAETSLQSEITSLGDSITQKQTAVDRLQTNLTNQMAQADSAIDSMQQQYSYLSTMFAAQQTADQMYANE